MRAGQRTACWRRNPFRGRSRLMSYSSGRHFCGQKTSRRASTPLRRSAFTCDQPVPARLTGRWRTRASIGSTIRSAAVSAAGLKRTLYRAARHARNPRRFADLRRIRSDFVNRFLGGDRAALSRYERELRESGLLGHLLEAGREHQRRLAGRGDGYSLGAIGYAEGIYLYAVVRAVRLEVAVETGVANGFSTAFLLQALRANGEAYGQLLAENPARLRGQMQAYAACDDRDIREVVRNGFGDLHAYVERVSGLPPAQVSMFFARGMLFNVVASMGLHEGDEPWAERLIAGCNEREA